MYDVKNDKVVELKDIPQSSMGAPIPIVVSGEHDAVVAYYLQNTPSDWDGKSTRVVSQDSAGEPVALVKFSSCYSHMFGPPNDEAFSGHPLSSLGLKPYGSFEVIDSSWLIALEQMNQVHPYHDPKSFYNSKRHFILSFHDSTFECVAKSFTVTTSIGSVAGLVGSMAEHLS